MKERKNGMRKKGKRGTNLRQVHAGRKKIKDSEEEGTKQRRKEERKDELKKHSGRFRPPLPQAYLPSCLFALLAEEGSSRLAACMERSHVCRSVWHDM
mmetsp:Transcript_14093/g.28264  ORF Transcript_14093/g.28264 Transcript_14093/m.28264 type:complete len:98 (+) Transcript_14093:70-363(+)